MEEDELLFHEDDDLLRYPYEDDEDDMVLLVLGLAVPHISLNKLANSVANSPPVPNGLSRLRSMA